MTERELNRNADLTRPARECSFEQPLSDAFRLLLGQDEELGKLDETITLHRADEAEELAC